MSHWLQDWIGEVARWVHSAIPAAPVPPVAPAAAKRPAPILARLEADVAVLDAAARFVVEVEGCPEKPYWPGATSGVTWGVGWDASENTVATLRRDWAALPPQHIALLEVTIGREKKGAVAQTLLPKVVGIAIPRALSMQVFRQSLLPRYVAMARQAFPGMEGLPVSAQVALISLVFNRGGSMGDVAAGKDRRWEMREIQRAVREFDVPAIAGFLRSMKRLWKGTGIERGMDRRREAEALLVDTAARETGGRA